ncbi:MAG TPA: amidohydrolase family protein [Gemmatimonadales bacterium]|nr:amidohydrolase family protein [Gemmatimonadales bacterium]
MLLFWLAATPLAGAQQVQAVVGGTLIDGTGAPPVADAVVVVQNGVINCAGPRAVCRVPGNARRIDARGRWVMPGLIDAHVHFSQTGWFDGRPDAGDFRGEHPYPKVIADLEARPQRFFDAYLCSGVTSVFDVGGYPWTWELRRRFADDPRAPRIAAVGPLLSTIDFWLNLPGQAQFIHMSSDSIVRATVRAHAAFGSDAVKLWYIMPPQPPDTARMQELVRAAGDEARKQGIPLIVHATGLWEAKDAIRAGARVLVHSVFDAPVDEEFVSLARESQVVYVTTITVTSGYFNAAVGREARWPYPLGCADSASRQFAALDLAGEPRLAWARKPGAREGSAREDTVAMANAKRLADAGVILAVGTDAGNPGTFHGPSIYRELELLQAAGLTPMQILVAATRNAANAMGRLDRLGTLERGKAADLLVLDADPVLDVRNVQRVRMVMKGGVVRRLQRP